MDILSPDAMKNAYYICHNVQVKLSNVIRVEVILWNILGFDVLQRFYMGRSF